MPALNVDRLEVFVSAAILICDANRGLSKGAGSEAQCLATCPATNVRKGLVAQRAPDTPRQIRLASANSQQTRRKARRWSRCEPSPLPRHRRAYRGTNARHLSRGAPIYD